MKTVTKGVVILALAGAIAATVGIKGQQGGNSASPVDLNTLTVGQAAPGDGAALPAGPVKDTPARPKLVDLGADKCMPCIAMAPILEELKRDYADTFQVEFIDVWKNPDAGKTYGIRLIPTQIFYDAQGKERFRHEGFFSKDDILATWKKLGVM